MQKIMIIKAWSDTEQTPHGPYAFSVKNVISDVIGQPSADGISIAEMRISMKILDAIESDNIELSDDQVAYLKHRMNSTRFKYASVNVIKLMEILSDNNI